MPPILIVGTRNRKKLGEIVEILGDLGLDGGPPRELRAAQKGKFPGGPRDRQGDSAGYPGSCLRSVVTWT